MRQYQSTLPNFWKMKGCSDAIAIQEANLRRAYDVVIKMRPDSKFWTWGGKLEGERLLVTARQILAGQSGYEVLSSDPSLEEPWLVPNCFSDKYAVGTLAYSGPAAMDAAQLKGRHRPSAFCRQTLSARVFFHQVGTSRAMHFYLSAWNSLERLWADHPMGLVGERFLFRYMLGAPFAWSRPNGPPRPIEEPGSGQESTSAGKEG